MRVYQTRETKTRNLPRIEEARLNGTLLCPIHGTERILWEGPNRSPTHERGTQFNISMDDSDGYSIETSHDIIYHIHRRNCQSCESI